MLNNQRFKMSAGWVRKDNKVTIRFFSAADAGKFVEWLNEEEK